MTVILALLATATASCGDGSCPETLQEMRATSELVVLGHSLGWQAVTPPDEVAPDGTVHPPGLLYAHEIRITNILWGEPVSRSTVYVFPPDPDAFERVLVPSPVGQRDATRFADVVEMVRDVLRDGPVGSVPR